jgi:hypothetical protein
MHAGRDNKDKKGDRIEEGRREEGMTTQIKLWGMQLYA